jgi:hypothetical protein
MLDKTTALRLATECALQQARETLERLRQRRPALVRSLVRYLDALGPDRPLVASEECYRQWAREISPESESPVREPTPSGSSEEDLGEIEGHISLAWMESPGGREVSAGADPTLAPLSLSGTDLLPTGPASLWAARHLRTLLDSLEERIVETHVRIVQLESVLERFPRALPESGDPERPGLLPPPSRPGLPAPATS